MKRAMSATAKAAIWSVRILKITQKQKAWALAQLMRDLAIPRNRDRIARRRRRRLFVKPIPVQRESLDLSALPAIVRGLIDDGTFAVVDGKIVVAEDHAKSV